MKELDLLQIRRGTVTAPAGCGKTQLIVSSLLHYTGTKPVLILTHTNAGVVALRERLKRDRVSSAVYRLSTIDGWVLQWVSTFPGRSGLDRTVLELQEPDRDYMLIREAAARLLMSSPIVDVLRATYARVIVDEYQDCSVRQHAVVTCLAEALPTCVLGDPMQAIFDFGNDPLVDWKEVCGVFPVVGELTVPHRWIKQGNESLGEWLIDVRRKLLHDEPIDIRQAPKSVTWVRTGGPDHYVKLLRAARVRPSTETGSVFVIADSANSEGRRQLASRLNDAVFVEPVELRDLVSFAREFNIHSTDAVQRLILFAQKVMTNIRASDLIRRVNGLVQGRAHKVPSPTEQLALDFLKSPSYHVAAKFLRHLASEPGRRTYRPVLFHACIEALELCDQVAGLTLYEAALRVRERYRILGRKLARRAVGSTLLLKGLECDTAVVLNASELDARNLYVAVTRAARSLIVCSPTPILNS